VERVLAAQKYRKLGKGERGLVRAYLRKVTGLSEAQSTRFKHAAALQNFYLEHLNPYLNFHRPCGFATVSLDERGRSRRGLLFSL
jgi:hypothetical protein